MTRLKLAGAAVAIAVLAACATRPVVPPSPAGARYPDFTYPAPPASVGDARTRAAHERAWQLLQVGDLRAAGTAFAGLVNRTPAFYPAAVGWGYVLLADGKQKDAIAKFDQALRLAPAYAPAIAGRGEAQLAAGQREQALASFEAALAADGGLTELRRRIDVLRFGRVRDLVAAATRAAEAGRLEEARQAYESAIAASPETAFLYRDLGIVETRLGALTPAVGHLQQAVAMDPADPRSHVGLADALEKRGDLDAAVAALERAAALEPSDSLKQRADRLRERAATAHLPAEYRAIPGLAQVTRGDLAALVAVKLQAVAAASRQVSSVVATDVRGHWAAAWIMTVIRAGLMDVYANHTFQPRAIVRRVDLAQLVSRVLSATGRLPSRSLRPPIADVGSDHLNYGDISIAVASGVMPLEGGLFRPSRPVSGQEAADAVQRLERQAAGMRRGDR